MQRVLFTHQVHFSQLYRNGTKGRVSNNVLSSLFDWGKQGHTALFSTQDFALLKQIGGDVWDAYWREGRGAENNAERCKKKEKKSSGSSEQKFQSNEFRKVLFDGSEDVIKSTLQLDRVSAVIRRGAYSERENVLWVWFHPKSKYQQCYSRISLRGVTGSSYFST